MRPASDDGYMPDCEMVIVAKMRTEMRVINAAPFFYVLIMLLFLFRLVVVLFSVLVLGKSSHRPTQKECRADSTDR